MFSGGSTFSFGLSVGKGLDLDGDVLAVGSPNDHIFGVRSGTTLMYRRIGGQWVQQQKLVPAHADDLDRFGTSVAVDGDTIVCGSPRSDIGTHALTLTGAPVLDASVLVPTRDFWNGGPWSRGTTHRFAARINRA